jgi:hypothetical protein
MHTKKLSDDDVIEKAQWIWKNGYIQRTGHFEVELKNAGATMVDVEAVLFGECKVTKTRWNQAHHRWRYTIWGSDSEGCELHLVLSIDPKKSRLILITAF